MFFDECTVDLDTAEVDVPSGILAYMDGYNNGLWWPDRWETQGKPGGPWVHRCEGPETCPARITHSYENNRLWCLGWEHGHAEKLRTNKKVSFEEAIEHQGS